MSTKRLWYKGVDVQVSKGISNVSNRDRYIYNLDNLTYWSYVSAWCACCRGVLTFLVRSVLPDDPTYQDPRRTSQERRQSAASKRALAMKKMQIDFWRMNLKFGAPAQGLHEIQGIQEPR